MFLSKFSKISNQSFVGKQLAISTPKNFKSLTKIQLEKILLTNVVVEDEGKDKEEENSIKLD
jgi:hypothetical protein